MSSFNVNFLLISDLEFDREVAIGKVAAYKGLLHDHV